MKVVALRYRLAESGWDVHRGVRDQPEEQSVSGLESDVVGGLVPSMSRFNNTERAGAASALPTRVKSRFLLMEMAL